MISTNTSFQLCTHALQHSLTEPPINKAHIKWVDQFAQKRASPFIEKLRRENYRHYINMNVINQSGNIMFT